MRWLPTYGKMDVVSDVIAGLTLGLTIVPQSIAYASLAQLPAKVGLNSAFAGGFLYVLFGTIKQVSIGPTSLMALLTLEYISHVPQDYKFEFLYLLTFLCGCVELIMGLLRLGFLVELISAPVISGFTSASALIIIASQIKHIMGVDYKSDNIRQDIVKLFEYRNKIRYPNTVLGIICIVFLLVLRSFKNIKSKNRKIRKLFWFISVGRNALTVIICCCVTYTIEKYGIHSPFKLTGSVEPGLPDFRAPTFEITDGNTTMTFFEMVRELRSGFIVIPIVAVLINVSIAKAFATSGCAIDATQEMLTLAVCNMFASFFSSMPICGAFTRSAVSNASGVRTPFANFYSAVITMFALTFLTPYFRYIPKATLAAVLIAAVIFLVDVSIIKPLWNSCKRDLVILLSTLVFCLYYGVEMGLLIGVILNFIHLVYMWARPTINSDKCKNEYGEYLVVTPSLGLFFPATDHLYSYMSKIVSRLSKKLPIAVNCCYIRGVDYTSIKGLSMIADDFQRQNHNLVFFNVSESITNMVNQSGFTNIKICNLNENLDEYLFGDILSFRRSVTFPLMDTELTEMTKVEVVDDTPAQNTEDGRFLLKN